MADKSFDRFESHMGSQASKMSHWHRGYEKQKNGISAEACKADIIHQLLQSTEEALRLCVRHEFLSAHWLLLKPMVTDFVA